MIQENRHTHIICLSKLNPKRKSTGYTNNLDFDSQSQVIVVCVNVFHYSTRTKSNTFNLTGKEATESENNWTHESMRHIPSGRSGRITRSTKSRVDLFDKL